MHSPTFGENQTQHLCKKNLIPTVKHDSGVVMIWVCPVDTCPGHLAVSESTMNSSVYQNILDLKTKLGHAT